VSDRVDPLKPEGGDLAPLRRRLFLVTAEDTPDALMRVLGVASVQQARLRAAPPEPERRANPYRPDPYALFAGYPTRHLSRRDLVALNPGLDWPAARARLEGPLAVYSRFNRPSDAELEIVVNALAEHGPMPVAKVIELIPPGRRNYLERGLLWLARHDIIALQPGG